MSKLIMTVAQMANRENWLKARNAGIGGSDAAAVVGLNPWKSPFALWLEKTGQSEPENLSENESVYWGTVLEELVARRFCELTGKRVTRRGLLQDDECPYMLASVDRLVVGEDAGLECKTANGFAAKAWEGDELPTQYYSQCQHYMMVTGYQRWYIACLIGGNHFIWKEIPRNEEDIAALREAEINFWNMVQKGIAPEADGSRASTEALGRLYGGGGSKEAITLGEDAEALLWRYNAVKKAKEHIDAEVEECKNRFKQLLGNNELGLVGETKVSWKTQAGRVTLDTKRLKKEKPDIFAAYSKQGAPVRVFKIYLIVK